MTLATRNALLYTGVIVVAMMLTGYLFVGVLILGAGSSIDLLPLSQRWFIWSWDVGELAPVVGVASAGVVSAAAMVLLFVCARVFRRITSAEIYFFSLFLFTISFELLRIGQLLVVVGDYPPQNGVLLTRFITFGRLVGVFAVFAASLYAVGVEFPRTGTLTLSAAALSFVIVWFMQVDTLALNASLTHVAGGASLDVVVVVTELLAMVNYVVASARGHRDGGALLPAAALSVVAGHLLLIKVPSILSTSVGTGLYVFGAIVYVTVNRRHYLWY